ncbi:MAG: hypothetical protein IIW31_03840 [Clostridia bacterium]|nr:hypothetical protein [Clostridia bacterium]
MNVYRIEYDRNDGPSGELARVLKNRIEARWDTEVRFDKPADLTLSYREGDRLGEIKKAEDGYLLLGTETHDLWNLAGKVLRSVPTGGEFRPHPKEGVYKTRFLMCGMYFATHFNNYYCVAPMEEIRTYIEDLALWGMEYLTMWFDLHHYTGMDDPKAKDMITRLLAIQEHVRRIGLKIGMGTMANEGFSTTPEHLKGTNEVQNGYVRKPVGYYHTEVCPSTEEGMALILKNRREMLDVFAKYKPDFISTGCYDQGGCTCKDCAPWGSNGYLRTVKEEAKVIREYMPNAKIMLGTWYFGVFYKDDTEWKELYAAFDRGELDFVDCMKADFPAEYPAHVLNNPRPCPVITFPEISMYGMLPWGGYGANPMPAHIQKKWDETDGVVSGGFPYSEGIYEDMNKAICLQLFREGRDPYDTVREYFRYECRVSEDLLDDAVEFIRALEDSHCRDSFGFQTAEHTVTPWHTERIEEAEALAEKLHESLSPNARENPRWQALYLRAKIDGELIRHNFGFSEEFHEYCAKLDDLYYSRDSIRQIRPYRKEQIPVVEQRITRGDWKPEKVLWWTEKY